MNIKIEKVLKSKNIEVGYIYFFIHMITEILCFYYLESISFNRYIMWIIPFLYDCLAFVPQGIIGSICDKYPKHNYCLIGIYLLLIGFSLFIIDINNMYLPLILICIGNCFIHVAGAELTLRVSRGKMTHSSLFVAGGSFGVITGKLFANAIKNSYIILGFGIILIILCFMGEKYKIESSEICNDHNYVNKKYPVSLTIFLMVFVVAIRSYIGYGIPTSWNKTMSEAVLLYFTMGVGKAMGGILIDTIGIKKTAKYSTLVSLPFLCFGDNAMIISLIGVMFFSMTMAITLAVLVSCMPKLPGVAFGWTTVGLFIGLIPIFFVEINDLYIAIPLLVIIGLIAYVILNEAVKENDNEYNC